MILKTVGLVAAAAFLLMACETGVQTSSGRDYLAAAKPSVAMGATSEEVMEAASVEPLLRLPAKIGLARIENGQLTPIPDAEMAAWARLAEKSDGEYGTFAPVNLLVAELATPRQTPRDLTPAKRVVRTIRLGAARQHMDAVFVYEVFGTSDTKQTPLSVEDLTLLGAFLLPGRKVEAVGHAEGLLIDVRNGYPYLTASETVDRASLSTSARQRGRGEDLKRKAITQAVDEMAEGLEPAIAQLAKELSALDTPS